MGMITRKAEGALDVQMELIEEFRREIAPLIPAPLAVHFDLQERYEAHLQEEVDIMEARSCQEGRRGLGRGFSGALRRRSEEWLQVDLELKREMAADAFAGTKRCLVRKRRLAGSPATEVETRTLAEKCHWSASVEVARRGGGK